MLSTPLEPCAGVIKHNCLILSDYAKWGIVFAIGASERGAYTLRRVNPGFALLPKAFGL